MARKLKKDEVKTFTLPIKLIDLIPVTLGIIGATILGYGLTNRIGDIIHSINLTIELAYKYDKNSHIAKMLSFYAEPLMYLVLSVFGTIIVIFMAANAFSKPMQAFLAISNYLLRKGVDNVKKIKDKIFNRKG